MNEEPVRGETTILLRPGVTGLAVVLCALLASSAAVSARTQDQSGTNPYEAVGTLLPQGGVSLNGVAALPHSTLYPGDSLYTSPGSLALLTTSDGSKIQVFGGSEVTIHESAEGIELSLKRGVVEVQSPVHRGAAVVADEVRAHARGRIPAAFRFDHRGQDIRVTTYQGTVEISGPALRDGPAMVSAGQIAWLTPQDPQTKPQPPYPAGAGKEKKEKRESARPRLGLYLLLAGGAAAGLATGIILATQSDPRP